MTSTGVKISDIVIWTITMTDSSASEISVNYWRKMKTKHIPNTIGFYASEDGRIYDSSGKERNYYRNLDGYKTVSVKLQNGNWVTLGVHRLIALTYIKTDDIENKHVNHIDNNKDNNSIENLEWVYPSLNNSHSAIMNTAGKRPILIARNTSNEHIFLDTIKDAASFLGISEEEVWQAIKNRDIKNGWSIFHHKRGEIKPPELRSNCNTGKRENGRLLKIPVKIKNLSSGEILHFASIHEASRYFDTTASHVYRSIISKHGLRLFSSKYIVTLEDSDFPELSMDVISKLTSAGPKEVIAYDSITNRYYVFDSASDFIRKSGLSKKAVSVSLKKERLRRIDRWAFVYMTKENLKQLALFVGCPDLTNIQSFSEIE